jgi:hypothetical protein
MQIIKYNIEATVVIKLCNCKIICNNNTTDGKILELSKPKDKNLKN